MSRTTGTDLEQQPLPPEAGAPRGFWWFASLALTGLAALSFAFAARVDPLRGGEIAHPTLLAAGALLLLAGGLVYGRAVRRLPPLPTPAPALLPAAENPANGRLAGLSALLLLLIGEINGGARGVEYVVSQHLQFLLFLLALFALLYGLRAFRRPHIDLADWLPAAALLLIGLVLRLWELEDALRFPIDEAHMMEAVAYLRADPAIELMQPFGTVSTFSWFYPYLQSLTSTVWGSNFFAMRLVSVVIGTLTIPAVYLLGRELFDRRVGLAAALVLTTFPPHLHFSRLGLLNIGETLFGVLAFAFFARALRTTRRGDAALAGVMLGMTAYFYEGGRLLYPAVMLAWLVLLALLRRGALRWRGVGWLALTAGLTALPFYYAWFASGVAFAPKLTRYTANAAPTLRDLLDNHLTPVVTHFVSRPDGDPFYYGGATPLLLVYVVPFFLLGLFALLWRGRGTPGALLPLLWLAAMIFGGSLLPDNTWTARYVVVFPALALLVGAGVVEFCGRWRTRQAGISTGGWRTRRAEVVGTVFRTRHASSLREVRIVGAVSSLLALLLMIGQAVYYFGAHLPLVNVQVRAFIEYDHIDALFRADSLPADTRAYLITDTYLDGFDLWQIRLYRPDLPELRVMTPLAADPYFFASLDPRSPHAFFLAPDDRQTQALVESILSPPPPQTSPYNVPPGMQYLLYFVPARTSPG
jgi:hypothetical protein